MGRVMKGEIGTAVRTLRRNKGRSILTMLGIIIGVASVVTVIGIGNGVTQQVSDQTEQLGKDLITIRPGQVASDSSGDGLGNFAVLTGVQVNGSLSQSDITAVTRTTGVAAALPLTIVGGGVTSGESGHHYAVPVIGTDAGFPAMVKQTLSYGTFFDPETTTANKVILGANVAQTLFDQNVPLGQTVTILGQQFIVSGILNGFQTAPLSVDIDFNDAVFISNDAARSLTNNNVQVYEILVRPANANQTDQVVDKLNGTLLAAHGGQHDFYVLKQGQTIAITNTILDLLTALVGGVAVISLLVGGVGIMNVMLVSVTERMHEIGIRKAIGATNRQILRQFVIEAAVLSVAGALFGVLLSVVIIIVLRLLTNLTPTITWQAALLACAVSVMVGILFGSIPALKAARKDPISALRNE